jgi:hypothetical protein
VDRCKVTVQPAGPAGERQVFLTLSLFVGTDDNTAMQQVDLVIPERTANQLGDALISGSVGIMREFDLSAEDPSSSRRRNVRTVDERFWKRHSSSLSNGPLSQSLFSLVRRLLGLGI